MLWLMDLDPTAALVAGPVRESLNGALGARVRQFRQLREMSLRELARHLAVSAATVSKLEHGQTGMSVERLGQIADVLDVGLADLLGPRDRRPLAGDDGSSGVDPTSKLRAVVAAARSADGTDWRVYPAVALDFVLAAALDSFVDLGYGGASVREIARRCGLSVPGLYHHYASKQDMLMDLLEIDMDSLLWRALAARAEGHGPVERFALLIECLVLHHTYRHALAFIFRDVRSLEPLNRERILRLRGSYQEIVNAEVDEAHDLGAFRTSHPHDAARAVVTMCTSIPGWYRPQGPSTPEEIASIYVRFALDLMRCSEMLPATGNLSRQLAADSTR